MLQNKIKLYIREVITDSFFLQKLGSVRLKKDDADRKRVPAIEQIQENEVTQKVQMKLH